MTNARMPELTPLHISTANTDPEDVPMYVDPEVAQAHVRLPPGAHGLEQFMCCNMTKKTHGTAAYGIMFDVEAVSGDVVIVGMQVCCVCACSRLLSLCVCVDA